LEEALNLSSDRILNDDDDDKTLHVSGIFSAHHQEFSTVRSALLSFTQLFGDRFQAESGCVSDHTHRAETAR
jgi:hypothetical protein